MNKATSHKPEIRRNVYEAQETHQSINFLKSWKILSKKEESKGGIVLKLFCLVMLHDFLMDQLFIS